VDRLFAALFAVPFGFVVTIVVSLLTPAPSTDIQNFVSELHSD
jgi:Na+(H+)/acetate symporter ActP